MTGASRWLGRRFALWLAAGLTAFAGLCGPAGEWFGTGVGVTSACSCLKVMTPRETLEESEVVMAAVVEANSSKSAFVRLRVLDVFKGQAPPIVWASTQHSSSCALPLTVGETYLIYVNTWPPRLGACDRVQSGAGLDAEVKLMPPSHPPEWRRTKAPSCALAGVGAHTSGFEAWLAIPTFLALLCGRTSARTIRARLAKDGSP